LEIVEHVETLQVANAASKRKVLIAHSL